jgi:hypothetical protein
MSERDFVAEPIEGRVEQLFRHADRVGGEAMMGWSRPDQRQLFYSLNLEEVVPDDDLMRAIAGISE